MGWLAAAAACADGARTTTAAPPTNRVTRTTIRRPGDTKVCRLPVEQGPSRCRGQSSLQALGCSPTSFPQGWTSVRNTLASRTSEWSAPLCQAVCQRQQGGAAQPGSPVQQYAQLLPGGAPYLPGLIPYHGPAPPHLATLNALTLQWPRSYPDAARPRGWLDPAKFQIGHRAAPGSF